jgi:hypothetical protein
MLSHNAIRELFPVNDPMVGHTVPGQAKIYHTRLATYHDNTSDPRLSRERAVNPVRQHMSMGDNHTGGHPQLKNLMAMLKKGSDKHRAASRLSDDMHMQALKKRLGMGGDGVKHGEGYSRMAEDLSWRGRTAQNAPQPKIKNV